MVRDGIICCVQDVHVRELVSRIHWSIRLRWFWAAAAFAAAVATSFGPLARAVDYRFFLVAGLVMVAANAWHAARARRMEADCAGTYELRRDCLLQVGGDYVVLTILVYGLGSIETPIMFMVLPNIILAALFFTRAQSLLVSVAGLVMISLPLVLETFGVLPVVTVYSSGLKGAILENRAIVPGFLGLLAVCVLFSWYLVSTITASLIRNELELETNYQAMLQLDEEKTQATLRGTHELKAPLAAVKSYCFALRDGYAGELPDRAREVVQRIADRCDRLLAKITDIIRLGNLKSYVVQEGQFHALEIWPLLVREVDEVRGIAARRGVAVDLDGEASGTAVSATEEHLRTILSNLLTNAVNYSHDNGRVRVRLDRDGRSLVLTVRDDGIGIPAEALSRIFDDHFRAANAAAHFEGGTGLGLPIVRATVRLLGGQINVQSGPETGTVFRVTIPALESEGE